MHSTTEAKLKELTSTASNINENIQNLEKKKADLNPLLDQITDLETSVDELLNTAQLLDDYSKRIGEDLLCFCDSSYTGTNFLLFGQNPNIKKSLFHVDPENDDVLFFDHKFHTLSSLLVLTYDLTVPTFTPFCFASIESEQRDAPLRAYGPHTRDVGSLWELREPRPAASSVQYWRTFTIQYTKGSGFIHDIGTLTSIRSTHRARRVSSTIVDCMVSRIHLTYKVAMSAKMVRDIFWIPTSSRFKSIGHYGTVTLRPPGTGVRYRSTVTRAAPPTAVADSRL
eukprot:752768-Hanusia_phi.AAC.5